MFQLYVGKCVLDHSEIVKCNVRCGGGVMGGVNVQFGIERILFAHMHSTRSSRSRKIYPTCYRVGRVICKNMACALGATAVSVCVVWRLVPICT